MTENAHSFSGKVFFKTLSVLAAFIIFFSIYFLPDSESLSPSAKKTLACAGLMVVLWLTEAIPIAATALLPILLFPLLNIMDLQEVTPVYGSPIVFLFMGGFTLALALEKWNLHLRIALNIIRLTGTSANSILAGFTIATALLSMWISNTATAVIMLPIAVSVIHLTQKENVSAKGYKNFSIALTLLIAYAANIGGMATLIGTPPNIVLKGLLESVYHIELSFSGWLIIGIPVSILLLIFTYAVVVYLIFPNRLDKFESAGEYIESGLQTLGPMKKPEIAVAIVFLLTAAAWVFRIPLNQLLGADLLSDTNIAIGGALILFFIPANPKTSEYLMDWPTMSKLPWGILILFGGGLALAGAMEKTGIIHFIGMYISTLNYAEGIGMVFILTGIMLFMTEFMSNVALCTVFLPMVFGISEGTGMNTLSLAIPVTLASSCAFMLPMGTPPNAIVFAGGYLKISHMARAGILLNVAAILLIVLLSEWLTKYIY